MDKRSSILLGIEDKLLRNSLFKLSLGSKELFHSNFIQGILDIDSPAGRSFTKEFFNCLGVPTEEEQMIRSDREKSNVDMYFEIYLPTQDEYPEDEVLQTIIFENKVKSLPDETQLRSYRDKFSRLNNPKFILLSIIKPEGFDLITTGWEYLSYSTLADHLSVALSSIQNDIANIQFGEKISFDGLIEEYISFIRTMAQLGNSIETNLADNYDFSSGTYLGVDFRKLRIHDLVLKLKYQQIGRLLQKEYSFQNTSWTDMKNIDPENHLFDYNTIYFNSDFTRSQGLFDIKILIGFVHISRKHIPHFLVVQLQGEQLRYGSSLLPEKNQKSEVKKIHQKIINHLTDVWLNMDILDLGVKRLGEGSGDKLQAGKKPGYCKFGDVFYFKYDLLKAVKKPQKISDIIGYYAKLITYIMKNRGKIQGQIKQKSGLNYS